MLIIHPHLHPRRTGVTAHTESVVRALAGAGDAFVWGRGLSSEMPTLKWGEMISRLRREPAVWHAHRNNELLLGLLLRTVMKQLKVVYTRHGHGVPSAFTRMLASRADARVALTEQAQALLPGESQVVPHGVDVERFKPPIDRNELWKATGWGGEYGIGVVGRIRPDKGQGDFVKAMAPLLEEFEQWRAVLVGLAQRPFAAWAEGLRKATNNKLILAGEHADTRAWYQSFTIVVQPSHAESFGLVMLEAMASGCCLVTSALPHVGRYVTDGETGFIYPIGDSRALERILRDLMKNPEKAAAVGRAAAIAVRKQFRIEQEAKAMRWLYESLF